MSRKVEFHEEYTVHESYRKGPTEPEISEKWKKIADIGSGRFGSVNAEKENKRSSASYKNAIIQSTDEQRQQAKWGARRY